MENKIIISIGREFASGGKVIGQAIAQKLGYKFYDSELINLAAKEVGFDSKIFREKDEQPVTSIFFENVRQAFNIGDNYLSDQKIFEIQSQIIKKIAQEDNCVIMGRCSDYILRENPNMMSIFFWAPIEYRVKRFLETQKISDKNKAEQIIIKADSKRSQYYNYYSGKTWGKSSSYDLCINSSMFNIEETANNCVEIIKKRFFDK